ncbi:hypothetical protein AAU61_17335 [Desulfocarbo indianensis]|nr:hypothetical protein AAU61_17335 [Desulfocarbo indianensis]
MLGWNIYDWLFLVMFAGTFVIRWPYARARRKASIVKAQFDLKEKAGLFLAFLGGLVLPAVYLFTPLLSFADYQVPMPCGVLGALLIPPSLWLFWRSHRDLGTQWSPKLELNDDHRLITNGVYGYVRHPMYTAVFLMCLAQLLLVGNWLAGPGYLFGFSILYVTRIHREEAFMISQFGHEYEAYMQRTSRLVSRALLSGAFRSH